jgi:carboxyl-terminal processing protease
MTPHRLRITFVALALFATACSQSAQVLSTTDGETPTSSSTTVTTVAPPGTGTYPNQHELDLVGCDDPPQEIAIVCEAYNLIKTHYVDVIDDAQLADAASLGLNALDGSDTPDLLVCATPSEEFEATCDLAARSADTTSEAAEAMVGGLTYALDANSGYFNPDALKLVEEEQNGEIEGIGAIVTIEDETLPGDDKQCSVVSETCRILVISTIDGTPADVAGLKRDDSIVAVDGEGLDGWTVDEVTAIVRGPAGTGVTLTIDRAGKTLDVTITRAAFVVPVIDHEVIGDVGYLRLYTFTGDASPAFESAVVDLLAQGVSALVIDLRGNPGGFLSAAIDVVSVFLPNGDVITTEGPDGSLDYEVNGDAIVPEDMPVTFVVDKGSASASEVVSAVLQERGRATIVGENTFGKNTVQQRFRLSNGGALKLTIARWVTPGGLDFGGVGVTPDVNVDVYKLTPEEVVAAVAAAA